MKNSLIQKYNVPGPRYTSYPTVPYWDETDFSDEIWAETLKKSEIKKVHTVGVTTDICVFLTVAGADAEGFKTAIHKQGVATFTDLGETMTNHMKRCFHTEIIE